MKHAYLVHGGAPGWTRVRLHDGAAHGAPGGSSAR